jgi:hypothetical protein
MAIKNMIERKNINTDDDDNDEVLVHNMTISPDNNVNMKH